MKMYQVDHRRLRFVEFLRLSHPLSLPAAIFWIPLKLGLTNWRPQLIPQSGPTIESGVPIESLPEKARDYMQSAMPEFLELGYVEPIFECQFSVGPTGEEVAGVAMIARHTNGTHSIQSLFGFDSSGAQQAKDQLISFLSADKIVATSNGRRTFDSLPSVSATYHPNTELREISDIHNRKLFELKDQLIPLSTNIDMCDRVDSYKERFFNHMIKRGVYVEVPSEP